MEKKGSRHPLNTCATRITTSRSTEGKSIIFLSLSLILFAPLEILPVGPLEGKNVIFFIFILIFIRATRNTTSRSTERKKMSLMIRLLSHIFSFSFAPRGLPRDGPLGEKG